MYFADARFEAQEKGYDDTFFAGDLNLCHDFPSSTSNEAIHEGLETCQKALHTREERNQVLFDAAKESKHVLHRRRPAGDSFWVLSVLWDLKLTMLKETKDVAKRAEWKLKALLRTRRFFSTQELVTLYKCHVLLVLEFPTPAVYHASSTMLEHLDKV